MPADWESREPDQPWAEWPRCPVCDELRPTCCPACLTAGSHFPLADYQAAPARVEPTRAAAFPPAPARQADDQPPLLRCLLCDEVFRPQFPPRCHGCGFEFTPAPVAAAKPVDSLEPIYGRVVILLMALVAGLGSLTIYLWLLFRS